jgi:hypothetical protein
MLARMTADPAAPATRPATASAPVAADLRDEIEAHRRALLDFVATAEAIAPAAWNAPAADGKWSPAQVTEHLRLSYATARAELAGRPGFRIRTKWWQRRIGRLLHLGKILDAGRFPAGVPAVREIRPGEGPYDRRELLTAFRDEGERFLAEAASAAGDRRATITHPFLGSLTLRQGIRFLAQHVRHHHAQIGGPRAA